MEVKSLLHTLTQLHCVACPSFLPLLVSLLFLLEGKSCVSRGVRLDVSLGTMNKCCGLHTAWLGDLLSGRETEILFFHEVAFIFAGFPGEQTTDLKGVSYLVA